MKFSSSVLVLLFLFFAAAAAAASVVEETPDDASGPGHGRRRELVAAPASVGEETSDDASGPGHRRRKLVAKSNGVHPETAAPTPTPTPPVSYLIVQPGQDCSIIAQQASTGIYTLRATVGQETILFSERPARMASTMATQIFVDQFKDAFATSTPNTAITFTGNKESSTASSNINGPLIVVLSQPHMVSSSIIEYTMTQSESQAKVASIDHFLETSGSCSIFIDGESPCLSATDVYLGVSTQNCDSCTLGAGRDAPFQTCYQYNGDEPKFCYTNTYYNDGSGGISGYYQCWPIPNQTSQSWNMVNVKHGTNNCGPPCPLPLNRYSGPTVTPPPSSAKTDDWF